MIDIDFSLSSEAKRALDRVLSKFQDADRLFAEAVREVGLEAAEQVARNLSGITVSHNGQNFVVNVQTGNLRRSTRIDWPLNGDPLSVGIFNNAEYAAAVEQGQTGTQRKAALLNSRRARVSKDGKRFIFVPVGPNVGFTVNEDSALGDIQPRPFLQAAAEQMRPRVNDLITEALNDAMKAS